MTPVPTERWNIADLFLDARVREGRGDEPALLTDEGTRSYADVQALANRFGRVLAESGVVPEQRILVAMPDSAEFVAALFGTLKLGAVAVMVNPGLPQAEIEYLLEYTRARAVVAHAGTASSFRAASRTSAFLKDVLVVGEESFDRRIEAAAPALTTFPSHRDDAAIWLFSGGTTGRPKAVVQTHRSFANTTECYGKGVIGYTERDITLSVPKLYFGYATGSNLFFPFSAGARSALFPEPATAEVVFEKIRRFRPTVLVNVPTMIYKMVSHPDARNQDLSSIRVCTSAGEALPVELYSKWKATFGVELLDGLGTAEMWHIFISNRPGRVRPGTLGTVVPGFEIRVCDDEGRELKDGVIHSSTSNDPRESMGQFLIRDRHVTEEQLFRALKYLRRPVVMGRFPGESHELSRSGDPWHRVERLQHITNWFDIHLQGKELHVYDIPGSAAGSKTATPAATGDRREGGAADLP